MKDDQGCYVKSPGELPPPAPDSNIDSMLLRGLAALDRLLRVVTMDISTGNPSRETVQNLKDVMGMLEALKKRESETLESMSEEDLLKAADAE